MAASCFHSGNDSSILKHSDASEICGQGGGGAQERSEQGGVGTRWKSTERGALIEGVGGGGMDDTSSGDFVGATGRCKAAAGREWRREAIVSARERSGR